MINTKIINDKNVLERLGFESLYSNSKSVLVVSDIYGGFSCAKHKIKKFLPKQIKINFVSIKDNKYASVQDVDKCLTIVFEQSVDSIFCVGGDVAISVCKAVKYFAHLGKKQCDFACSGEKDNLQNQDIEICDSNDYETANNDSKSELSKQGDSEEAKQSDSKSELSKQEDINIDINLNCIVVIEGNHQTLLSGRFEIMDSKQNTLYMLSKSASIPNIVMIDDKILDRFGEIARRGMELGILIMGLLTISNVKCESDKINSITALGMIGKSSGVSLSDLVSAEMLAGFDFVAIPNNVLHEFVLRGIRLTDAKYQLILTLIMKKAIKKVIDNISDNDIQLLGGLYGIETTNSNEWKEQLCKIIDIKFINYFVEKDIPSVINEVGLNSKQIEEISTDLVEKQFEKADEESIWLNNLSLIKDLVYYNYE